jgi:hypothetical protein
MPRSPLAHLEGLLGTPYVPQGSRPPRRDVFRYFSELAVQYPGVYSLWVFHPLLPFARPTITLTDPQLVARLLEQDKVTVVVVVVVSLSRCHRRRRRRLWPHSHTSGEAGADSTR